jgi:uncharacterized protein (TIGR00369 family)
MSDHRSAVIIQQLSAIFTTIPFNQLLGLRLDHLDDQHAIMSFNMKNELVGNFMHGILHGGVISSVLDMVGGILVMAVLIHKNPEASLEEMGLILGKCSTIDLHVSYLRPGLGEMFTAKAWLQKSGHSIAFTRMELFNDKENVIATASGTYWAQH